MRMVFSLLGGLLFGVGLTISGMVNPDKILSFLDVAAIPAGGWDPTLAFVMGGALIVAFPAFLWAKGRATCLVGDKMSIPQRRDIDRKLIVGSLLFGAGWGLAGYCPGPVVSGLAFGYWQTGVVAAAMLVGMFAYRRLVG